MKFSLPYMSNVTLETSGPGTGDTTIYLYTPAGAAASTYFMFDANSGEGAFSKITANNLASGDYYMRVHSPILLQVIPEYYIDLTIVPIETPTDTPSPSVTPTITTTVTATLSRTATATSTVTATAGTPGITPVEVYFQYGVNPSTAYAGSKDVSYDSLMPDDNYSASAFGYIGAYNAGPRIFRTILYFDVSEIPANAVIYAATLRVYTGGITGTVYLDAYALTRDWSETAATWNSHDTGSAWTASGGDFGQSAASNVAVSAIDWVNIPLSTEVVRQWVADSAVNYGLLLKDKFENPSASNFCIIDTKESTNTNTRPRLYVSYMLP